MERIKQALERANIQRANEPTQSKKLQRSDANRTRELSDIRYTETTTTTLEPKVLASNRILSSASPSLVSNSYKILRTQVLQRMREKGWNSLAITSTASGEGKSLTAVNLAISIAGEVNHTVLLVDLDLRHPSIHRLMGLDVQYGITDFANHDVKVSEILVNPGVERLVVLPNKERVENSSELLSSPRLVNLVEDLKSRYPSRIVLFDLPPLLSADDAMAFSPYVDAALVVIEDGKTPKEELKRALGFLRTTALIGTVLNKADPTISRYAQY